MQKTILLVISLLLLASCASNKGFYNKPQEDIHFGVAEDDQASVDIAYIGALGRNFIFECNVKNISGREINVDQNDFLMLIDNRDEIMAVNPDREIQILKQEKQKLKKQQKTNTILAIVGVGLTVLSGAAAGVPAVETIAYAAEPLYYAADDAAWSDQNIESVDDEVGYLNNALFDDEPIAPQRALTKDVIFQAQQVNGDVTIVVYIDGREYAVDFDESLFDL